jgi:hypothetical protein
MILIRLDITVFDLRFISTIERFLYIFGSTVMNHTKLINLNKQFLL